MAGSPETLGVRRSALAARSDFRRCVAVERDEARRVRWWAALWLERGEVLGLRVVGAVSCEYNDAMGFPVKAAHLPGRLATGGFILSSGLEKLSADEQHAAALHGLAVGAYPFLSRLKPGQFVRLLAGTEVTLGAALLTPIVPTALAAAGLAAFSGGLVGLYLRTPALRQPGSLRPSQQGIAVAKDIWMFGIALGFLVDELTSRKD